MKTPRLTSLGFFFTYLKIRVYLLLLKGENQMSKYVAWMDSHPRIVKLILCIWILDITWAVYRIGRAASKQNWLHMVLGILWVLLAATAGWILDIVWIILNNRIFWFKED